LGAKKNIWDFEPVQGKMAKKYDVIIVGGGPAGIFAALELCQASNLSILLIEKGERSSNATNPKKV